MRNDLTGKRFGKLTAIEPLKERKNKRIVWKCKCDCGNYANVISTYLTNGDTKSCGCIKNEQNKRNLRDSYDKTRVNDVVKPLFKGKEPRKDSSTGYRGVSRYYTRKTNKLRYRAWITVKGKQYYKSGFTTPEDAYYNGRLVLEDEHLPGNDR